MGIKPGPKRIAKTTGKPDKRQRDNKETPGNTPSLKPHKHKREIKISPYVFAGWDSSCCYKRPEMFQVFYTYIYK